MTKPEPRPASVGLFSTIFGRKNGIASPKPPRRSTIDGPGSKEAIDAANKEFSKSLAANNLSGTFREKQELKFELKFLI